MTKMLPKLQELFLSTDLLDLVSVVSELDADSGESGSSVLEDICDVARLFVSVNQAPVVDHVLRAGTLDGVGRETAHHPGSGGLDEEGFIA